MKKCMYLLLSTLLLLLLFAVPASAQVFTFDQIHASLDVPDGEYEAILTQNTMEANRSWISSHGMDPDALSTEFKSDGILLKAYDSENNRTFVLSALQNVDAQMYFDLNEQDETMRREFRVSHTDGSAYGVLGYTYSSSAWKNYGGTTLRFLNTKYTLNQNGETSYGYQKKTIRNGYTIVLDMQVTGRKAAESDLKALNKLMDNFSFTQILPMPKLPARLIFSSEPPSETGKDTFTIKGITSSRAEVTVTVLSLSSSDSKLFTDTAGSGGDFSVKVTLPGEGVYTVTIVAEGEETLPSQVSYTVHYQKGLLAASLTADPPSLLSDITQISGDTLSGARTQLVVSGPGGYQYDKTSTSSSFNFSVDTSLEGSYTFSLLISKKGYEPRTFTFTGSRNLTDTERLDVIRERAKSPDYSRLRKNLSDYQGDIVTYTGYVAQISETKSVGEWTIVFATTQSNGNYRNPIYVITNTQPTVKEGEKAKMYGVVSGDFPIIQDDAVYPRCVLHFFDPV